MNPSNLTFTLLFPKGEILVLVEWSDWGVRESGIREEARSWGNSLLTCSSRHAEGIWRGLMSGLISP